MIRHFLILDCDGDQRENNYHSRADIVADIRDGQIDKDAFSECIEVDVGNNHSEYATADIAALLYDDSANKPLRYDSLAYELVEKHVGKDEAWESLTADERKELMDGWNVDHRVDALRDRQWEAA